MREMPFASLFVELSIAPLTLYPIIKIFIHSCKHFLILFAITSIWRWICHSVSSHHCLSELHTLKLPFWYFTTKRLILFLCILHRFFHSSPFFYFKRFCKLIHFFLLTFWFPLTFCVKNFSFLHKYFLTDTFMLF
jgi:hypothetical protein